jgi:hypothetical protein
VYAFVVGLVFTIVIESIVILMYGLTEPKVLKTAFYVNIITNPIMNIVLSILVMFFRFDNTIFLMILLELIVVFVELKLFNMVYKDIINKNTILKLVISMNVISFLIGLLFSRMDLFRNILFGL